MKPLSLAAQHRYFLDAGFVSNLSFVYLGSIRAWRGQYVFRYAPLPVSVLFAGRLATQHTLFVSVASYYPVEGKFRDTRSVFLDDDSFPGDHALSEAKRRARDLSPSTPFQPWSRDHVLLPAPPAEIYDTGFSSAPPHPANWQG